MKAPVPREQPAAVVVSDATSFAVLGLTGRQFVAWLKKSHIHHARVGRKTLARLDDCLAALDKLTGRDQEPPPWNEDEIVQRAARGTRS